jgi:uracil-DNA glycosylase family 4
MSALHRTGFANRATSQRANDGLKLTDAYITMAVRCAPPDNKPTPQEIRNCFVHLEAEIRALDRVRVVVALGKVGFDSYVRFLNDRERRAGRRPHFGHGLTFQLGEGPTLIGCYHPSRQNTHTGKLTSGMIERVFGEARRLLG